ncbi:MAG: hypothetical protein JWL81_1573, partial [Verrucomicrobiales bacterium]|nr:hypothetical protein [Verrucomicrobiales bacterium]
MSLPEPATPAKSDAPEADKSDAALTNADAADAAGRGSFVRRWIPCYGTAGFLLILAGIAAALRMGIVAAKPLARAKERWAFVRQDSSKGSLKWEDAAVLGTHWSTLAALGLVAAAFFTMRWWVPRRRKNNINRATDSASASASVSASDFTTNTTADSAPDPVPDSSSHFAPAPAYASNRSRWFGPALLALLILAGALRLPLASGSLWWDELWNIKYATVGEWKQEPLNADAATFQPTSWPRAAWYYNKPTNHPVVSLPSKLGHEIWRAVTQPEDPGAFNETVLRLPVLLAGLAAILLTANLARRLAGDPAALFTAALMAIHPWLLRYGVDARSYGMAVFFIATGLTALERATHPETRRPALWWWLFGACQFFLMWSHVVAHLAVCAGLCAAVAWLILRSKSPDKFQKLARLLVINALAAAFLLVAFLPNLLQALTWGERNDDGNLLTGSY